MPESELSATGFSALLNAAVDAIIIISANGTILNFNQAAQLLFGYSMEEITNKNVNVLMPQPYRKEHDDYLQHYRDTGQAKIIGIGRQVSAIKKDGSVFPINLAVGEYTQRKTRYFIGIIRDLTHQVETERLANAFRDRLAHVTESVQWGKWPRVFLMN